MAEKRNNKMKNKNKDKKKVGKKLKYDVAKRERWAVFFNTISAFGLSVISLFTAINHGNVDLGFYILLACSIVLAIVGIVSIILLGCNIKAIKKYQQEYNYYSESKRISDILLTAVKRTGFAKTNSILRSTYGTVPDWHPIDYCENILIYDVHEHLRNICAEIKQLVVSLAPEEFNDDMVTVDIAFEYPSDKDFSPCAENQSELSCRYDEKIRNKVSNPVESLDGWKIITSGDRTSSRVNLHKYLSSRNSFYDHLMSNGYAFCNDKIELEKENHYIWTHKDYEYGRVGSVVGSIIELKNDNPEMVFVRVFVTVSTYGRRLVEDGDLLDEATFEKLFKATVINSYKTIIEEEVAQMFIRHGIRNGYINRHNGKLCETNNGNYRHL